MEIPGDPGALADSRLQRHVGLMPQMPRSEPVDRPHEYQNDGRAIYGNKTPIFEISKSVNRGCPDSSVIILKETLHRINRQSTCLVEDGRLSIVDNSRLIHPGEVCNWAYDPGAHRVLRRKKVPLKRALNLRRSRFETPRERGIWSNPDSVRCAMYVHSVGLKSSECSDRQLARTTCDYPCNQRELLQVPDPECRRPA